MFSFFKRPFPPYASGKHNLWVAIFPGIVVFAMLFLLKPFGFHFYPTGLRAFISTIYGLATFLFSAIFLLVLPAKMPKLFDGLRWTVGKEILFFCVLLAFISLANAFINMWFQTIPFTMSMFGRMVGYTILIGVVPITFAIFAKQQALLIKFQREANVIEKQLQQHLQAAKLENPKNKPATFILIGDNQEEKLELSANEWLAAVASDNYCKIYYNKDGKVGSVMFRCTLKKMETALWDHPSRFRCHKSYFVNLAKVAHISGNAQGYRLHLQGMKETIPVSRGLNDTIKQKIALLGS